MANLALTYQALGRFAEELTVKSLIRRKVSSLTVQA